MMMSKSLIAIVVVATELSVVGCGGGADQGMSDGSGGESGSGGAGGSRNAAGTPRSPRSALAAGSVAHALVGATSAADDRELRCNHDDGDERFRHHHPPPKNGDATRYCTSRALDRIRATASLSVGREGTSEVVALYFRSD